jgi:hypothetical protein
MGFKFSDRNENGMVFLRNSTDHHSVALIQATEKSELPSAARWGSTIWPSRSLPFPSFSKYAISSSPKA